MSRRFLTLATLSLAAAAAQVDRPILAGPAEPAKALAEHLLPPLVMTAPFGFVPLQSNVYKERFASYAVGQPLAEIEAAVREELARLEAAGRGDSSEAADVLACLVEILTRSGKLRTDEVLRAAERSWQIREALFGPRSAATVEALRRLGVVRGWMGDYSGAVECHERAVAAIETGPNAFPVHVRALIEAGRYAEARQVAEKQMALGGRPPLNAARMGSILASLGDFDSAERLLEHALAQKSDTAIKAAPKAELAGVLAETGRSERAVELFEQALRELQEIYGPWHPLPARARLNLAVLQLPAGRYAEAFEHVEMVRRAHDTSLHANHPDRRLERLARAALLTIRGEHDAARRLYEPLEAEARTMPQDSSRLRPHVIAACAWFHAIVGERHQALEGALALEAAARDTFRRGAREIAEREALSYGSIRLSGLDLALTLLAEGTGGESAVRRVWNEVIRSRALVLDEMMARSQAAAGRTDPETARLVAERARSRQLQARFLFDALGADDPSTYAKPLEQAQLDAERAERLLAESTVGGRPPTESAASVEQLARALPATSALVAYVRYADCDLRSAHRT